MIETHLYILLALVGTLLACIARKRSLAFEYPFFMAGVFAVFILPQAYSLIRFRGGVGPDDVANVLCMCWLCLGAAFFGYQFKPRPSIVRWASRPVNPVRAEQVAMALVGIGVVSQLTLRVTQVAYSTQEHGYGLTGVATILLFFGGLTFPGFAIYMALIWQKATPSRMLGAFVSSIVPITSILAGRREPAIIFGLTLVLTSFFARRRSPHPIVIYGTLVFAMLAIPITGTYRGLHASGEYAAIRKLDLVQNFKDFFGKESILELRNAAALIKATSLQKHYGYGSAYWDNLVFRFVPAQLVGARTKQSMMFVSRVDLLYANKLQTSYEIPVGSTITGMGDSFEQFGWLGCLVFAGIGILFKSVWTAALKPQALFAQLFYMMICSSAMRAVTHQTVDFLPGVIYQLIFLGAIIWYAGLPHPPEVRAAPPPMRGSRSGRGGRPIYGRRPGYGMPAAPESAESLPTSQHPRGGR